MRRGTNGCTETGTENQPHYEKTTPKTAFYEDFYRKIKRNKAALVGGYLILFLTIVSLIGPYFLSNGINDVDYTARLQPQAAEYWLGTDQHGRGYIFPELSTVDRLH